MKFVLLEGKECFEDKYGKKQHLWACFVTKTNFKDQSFLGRTKITPFVIISHVENLFKLHDG